MCWLKDLFTRKKPEGTPGYSIKISGSGPELPTPKSRIPYNKDILDAIVRELEKVFGVGRVYYSPVGSSNSMEPLIDDNMYLFMVKITEPWNLQVGDIAIYDKDGIIADRNYDYDDVIHSVVAINEDEDGRYFTFKGLNNPIADKLKVREKMLVSFLAGMLYMEVKR